MSKTLRTIATGAALMGTALPAAAWAQASGPQVSLEGTTDLRERGLSWSGGDAALELAGTAPVGDNLEFDLAAATLRNSARHGGADLGLTIASRYRTDLAGFGVAGGVRGNVFVGRSGMSYVELTGEIDRTLGPARLTAGAEFAPSQDAIGGHSFHVGADLSVGVPGMPLTVFGGLGHTSGSSSDDPRASRLRPGGSYSDHKIGAEYRMPGIAAGMVYSGTSIDTDAVDRLSPYYDRHHGGRLIGYLRIET